MGWEPRIDLPTPAERDANCTCGGVEFDTKRCTAGEVLTCPWCWQQYRYVGAGRMTPLGAGRTAEAKDTDGAVPASAPAHEPRNAPLSIAAAEREAPPRPPDQQKGAGAAKIRLRDSNRVEPRIIFKDPPGGIIPMVLCIVFFNTLAFVATAYLLLKQPDGSRAGPWGLVAAKSAYWPELVAIVVGHVVAFCAWTVYVSFLGKRKGAAGSKGPAPPDHGARKDNAA